MFSDLRHASPVRALAVVASMLALGGCASAVSVSSFKGEEKEVAQTIADLQRDTSARDEHKVCTRDLASALLARLNEAPGGCAGAIKNQQEEIDPGLEVTVKSVTLAGPASARTASARVKSTFSGKTRASTLTLVKERKRWKISGLR
jgi:hypothetical protein